MAQESIESPKRIVIHMTHILRSKGKDAGLAQRSGIERSSFSIWYLTFRSDQLCIKNLSKIVASLIRISDSENSTMINRKDRQMMLT